MFPLRDSTIFIIAAALTFFGFRVSSEEAPRTPWTPRVPILDPSNTSQKQEREDRSMALMAKELQELRIAYAKLLESNERGGTTPVAAAAPPDESFQGRTEDLDSLRNLFFVSALFINGTGHRGFPVSQEF